MCVRRRRRPRPTFLSLQQTPRLYQDFNYRGPVCNMIGQEWEYCQCKTWRIPCHWRKGEEGLGQPSYLKLQAQRFELSETKVSNNRATIVVVPVKRKKAQINISVSYNRQVQLPGLLIGRVLTNWTKMGGGEKEKKVRVNLLTHNWFRYLWICIAC